MQLTALYNAVEHKLVCAQFTNPFPFLAEVSVKKILPFVKFAEA